jgi:hypothetical protein
MQTDEGEFNTQYKGNKKQKMGTYAVNIYCFSHCDHSTLEIYDI